MKRNILFKITFSTLLVFTLAGCVKEDDLIQVDPNVATEASFWKTPEDAVNGLNAVYGKLCVDGTYMRSTPLLLDLKGDDCRSHSPWSAMANVGKFNTGIADPAIYGWAYETYYQGIYRANQVLANVPNIEMDQAVKDRIMGQAYFLRGLYLFHAVNMFKSVPVPLNYTDLYHPQRTEAEGWAQVIQDFKDAADRLPVSYNGLTGPDEGMTAGRATKGAALAYLGKSYLFTKDFTNAEITFKSVIDLNVYSLVPDYRDNFTASNENNSESVFEVQFSREAGGVDLSWCCVPIAGWGRTSARAITYAPRGFGWTDVQPTWALFNEFMEEKTINDEVDPRLNATILYDGPGVMLYGNLFSEYYANNAADLNDLFCRKYQNDETNIDEFDWRSGINERIMRYADVLLMYAECLNENDKTGMAYDYIQMVRDRVNLPNLQTVKPNMNQDEMREQIAHERYLELALEGHRFDDIRRWGWLKDPVKLDWLKSRDAEYETYVVGREFFPIPQTEVDNNPGTQQNDGY
ncbi:MAG: RagB/SusD family nutrient uptake outer membrane protein [Saprospiraceae bacterium]